jgi:O-antigen/teichoic acid export membrane protein
VLASVLIKPLTLLLENKVQDQVGHAIWGSYSASFAFCLLMAILADMGVSSYATQQYAQNPAELRNQFPLLWGIKLFLGICFPFVIIGLDTVIGQSTQSTFAVFLIASTVSITQLAEFLRFYLMGMQVFRVEKYFSTLEKGLFAIVIGFLIYSGIIIREYIVARVLIGMLALILIYVYTLRLIGYQRPTFKFSVFWGIVRKSFPFAFMSTLVIINLKIDQVLLQYFSGDAEAGIYAGAFRWLDAYFMYLWIVLPFFFARFAHLVGDYVGQQRLFNLGQLLTAIPLIFIAIFVFFYGEVLLFLFTNSTALELERMLLCMKLLFATGLLCAFFAIFDNIMTASGYIRHINVILVICVIQNLVLNIIFIPRYGAIAAATTTFGSQCIMAVGYLYVMKRYMRIKIPVMQMVKLAILTLLLALTFYVCKRYAWIWWQTVLLSGVLFLGYIWMLRLIPLEIQKEIQDKWKGLRKH